MTFPFHPATLLAPMEGVSHAVFRSDVAARGGLGVVCTEFVRISRAPIGAAQLREHVIKSPGVPLLVQLMGNEADDMADAAAVLADAGADVVDLNMGCPTKRASNNGVGAAMLKDVGLVDRVVSALRKRIPGLMSVKMRAGFDDPEHVLTLARTIESAGADFLTIHPRLRRDQYNGVADWRIITRIKEAVRIPVVGNGDVWYADDALRMRRETGCDAVMIGRPAIRNPWIFAQIASLEAGTDVFRPTGQDLASLLRDTANRYIEYYEGRAMGPMKEMIRWCARAVFDDHATAKHLMRAQTFEELLERVDQSLAHLAADELDLGATGTLEHSGRAIVLARPEASYSAPSVDVVGAGRSIKPRSLL
ncbi:MAG: tRNA-dihydrouridine synthase family protein [Clostridia bacterium]|nr:tRNA-dihydrouridine synthase family protein [Deltaproteobacteria bacterium]